MHFRGVSRNREPRARERVTSRKLLGKSVCRKLERVFAGKGNQKVPVSRIVPETRHSARDPGHQIGSIQKSAGPPISCTRQELLSNQTGRVAPFCLYIGCSAPHFAWSRDRSAFRSGQCGSTGASRACRCCRTFARRAGSWPDRAESGLETGSLVQLISSDTGHWPRTGPERR